MDIAATVPHKYVFAMKKVNLFILSFATLCFSSCGVVFSSDYGATEFSNDDIRLGATKESVIKKYGKPYTQELEMVDGKTFETIGYKERMHFGYSINTFFIFEDGELVKKLQEEEKPRPEIKIDKE